MSKTEVEQVKKIRTSYLKKYGYFCGWKAGTVGWTNKVLGGVEKSSVGIEVSTAEDVKYIRIYYSQTNNDSGEKGNFDYKIQLVQTPCYFGGLRHWFKCRQYIRGRYCGRRVGVLYKAGELFGCRHCYNLTYASRNLSGKVKSLRSIFSYPELEEMREGIRRLRYKGKPTKRLLRYLKKSDQSIKAYVGRVGLFTEKIEKIQSKKHKK